MPGMRAAVSDTAMSGSLPMSAATIASTIWSLLRLTFRADCNARRMPVTTMVLSSGAAAGATGASAFCAGLAGFSCAVAAGLGGASWAAAGDAIAHTAAQAVVDQRND